MEVASHDRVRFILMCQIYYDLVAMTMIGITDGFDYSQV